MRAGWTLMAMALLLAGPARRAPAQDAPPVDRALIEALRAPALAVAGKARLPQALEIVSAMRLLGLPAADAKALTDEVYRTAAPAKHTYGPLPAVAAQVRKAAAALEAAMAAAPPAARKTIAEALTRLDGEIADARAALDHTRSPTGGWQTPQERAQAQQLARMLEFTARARELEVPLEVGDSSHGLLSPPFGGFGARVRYKNFTLHTEFSKEQAARVMREAVRGAALSNALRTGTLELPDPTRFTMVIVTTQESWQGAVARANGAGALQVGTARALEQQYFWDQRGWFARVCWEQAFASRCVMNNLLVWRDPFKKLHAYAGVGHQSWIILTYLRSPIGVWRMQHSVSDPNDAGLPAAHRKERQALRKLSGTGLAGYRAWMAYHARLGTDIPFDRCFLGDLGKITGDVRYKLSLLFWRQHELGPIESLLEKLQGTDGISSDAFAKATGVPTPELERRWRHWILDGHAGVAQQLDPPAAPEPPKKAKAFWRVIAKARKDSLNSVPANLLQDPEPEGRLSAGAALHATFLAAHADRNGAAALIQPPGSAGYTRAGAWAAHHGLVARAGGKPEDAAEAMLATLEGRTALLDPGLTRIGVGWNGDVCVADARSMTRMMWGQWSFTWPADGGRRIPLTYGASGLPPLPGADPATLGYPLSMHRSPYFAANRIKAMELTERGDETVIDCHFVTSDDARWSSRLPPGVTALIPKAPLKRRTEYTVEATAAQGGPFYWSFKTK